MRTYCTPSLLFGFEALHLNETMLTSFDKPTKNGCREIARLDDTYDTYFIICWKNVLTVAYRGGQRGRFAPGGTLRGAAKKGKTKKRKGKRKKGKKKEKENMGGACNHSKTKMEHLSCGAPVHVKPKISAPSHFGALSHFGADAWLGYTCFCIGRQNV